MKLQRVKETAKSLIIPPILKKNKQKSFDIWKGINSLVNIKSSKTFIIKLLDENNNLISDPRSISHKFNHYFSTIVPDIERGIPTIKGNFKDYFDTKDANGKVIIDPLNSLFFLSPTVPGEKERIIDGLDIKKSTGPNSIPLLVLKSL